MIEIGGRAGSPVRPIRRAQSGQFDRAGIGRERAGQGAGRARTAVGNRDAVEGELVDRIDQANSQGVQSGRQSYAHGGRSGRANRLEQLPVYGDLRAGYGRRACRRYLEGVGCGYAARIADRVSAS